MSTMTLVDDGRLFAIAPERSLQQRLDALDRANDIRTRRAQMKRDIKGGRRDGVAALLDPPAYADTMKAFDMLMTLPKVGRVKASKALNQCRVSPSKTLGGMTQRQRAELASWLRSR